MVQMRPLANDALFVRPPLAVQILRAALSLQPRRHAIRIGWRLAVWVAARVLAGSLWSVAVHRWSSVVQTRRWAVRQERWASAAVAVAVAVADCDCRGQGRSVG
jgi:hypothetical protein